jgi:hypothetical protein
LVASLSAACGSRTDLDDVGSVGPSSDAGLTADAGDARDASPKAIDAGPKHAPLPPGFYCFGDVTMVKNVSCTLSRGATGASCEATLLCNGDHTLTATCADGLCTCDNPGFDTCYCTAPEGLDDPCGDGNCCWR